VDEPRLPRTPEPEEYFLLGGRTVEYSVPPRTPEEFYAHTGTSMMAIGVVMSLATRQRLASQGGAAAHTTQTMLYGNASGQGASQAGKAVTMGGVAESVAEHNLTDYGDYYASPLPAQGAVGQYVERRAEDGRVHGTVQLQPPVLVPDIPNDATLAEIQASLLRAQERLAAAENTEYIWDSTEPYKVLLHRGPSSVELNQLSPEELRESARLLRRVAITTAMVHNNQAVLEALLPPEHEVSRKQVSNAIATAARHYDELYGSRRRIEQGPEVIVIDDSGVEEPRV
jgi:hypothetical protein